MNNMISLRPHQLTRIGELYLEEAVLDVLFEAQCSNEVLKPPDISRRTGIFSEGEHAAPHKSHAIVWGLLHKLVKHNRVVRTDPITATFALTDDEYANRRLELIKNSSV